jgi:hypothetical protein
MNLNLFPEFKQNIFYEFVAAKSFQKIFPFAECLLAEAQNCSRALFP